MMKKTSSLKNHKVQEMAPEYRFDYTKAKPNRFAEKMNLDVRLDREKVCGVSEWT